MGFEADEKVSVTRRLALLESTSASLAAKVSELEQANAALTVELATVNASLSAVNDRVGDGEVRDAESILIEGALLADVGLLSSDLGSMSARVGNIESTVIADREANEAVWSTWAARYSGLVTEEERIAYSEAAGTGAIADLSARTSIIEVLLACEEGSCPAVASQVFVAEGLADIADRLTELEYTDDDGDGYHDCIDNDVDGDGLYPADDDDNGDTILDADDPTRFGDTCS